MHMAGRRAAGRRAGLARWLAGRLAGEMAGWKACWLAGWLARFYTFFLFGVSRWGHWDSAVGCPADLLKSMEKVIPVTEAWDSVFSDNPAEAVALLWKSKALRSELQITPT